MILYILFLSGKYFKMLLTFFTQNAIIVSNDTLFKGEIMSRIILPIEINNKLVLFLSELFLFKNTSSDDLNKIAAQYEFQIFEFESDENIYTPDDFSKKVGFVYSGECIVEKQKSDGNSVPLNLLRKNDSFGIMTVFSSSDKFPTTVKAKKTSRIVFIEAEVIISLIKEYSNIALSVIEFMSNRIEFLNNKIATFSADSVEEKLVLYILREYEIQNSEKIKLNLSKTAEILNAGRASIYRAINSLEELNLIKFENKKIYIIDQIGLERITQ